MEMPILVDLRHGQNKKILSAQLKMDYPSEGDPDFEGKRLTAYPSIYASPEVLKWNPRIHRDFLKSGQFRCVSTRHNASLITLPSGHMTYAYNEELRRDRPNVIDSSYYESKPLYAYRR
jgi:hypothetical protein